jgi:hypothetical protein
MERKMFGHHIKKRMNPRAGEDQIKSGRSKDNPPNYEGKEHVKYADPGYTRHEINIPHDEPHMKSHAGKEEQHEMEDNFHMGVPDQTEDTLERKIKRARMKMDAPDQEDAKPLRGNIVHDVKYSGEEDTSGEEEMGPHDMQHDQMSKPHRKKMIVSVMKKKMKKRKDMPEKEEYSQGKRNYPGTAHSHY